MTRIAPLFLDNNIYFAQEMRSLIGGIVPGGGSWGHTPRVLASSMQIQMDPGSSYVPDTTAAPLYTCVSDAPEPVTLNTAPPANQSRIDLVICRPRPATNDWIFDVVTGTPATSPAVPARPATPAGTLAICAQTVIGGQPTLDPLGPGGWVQPNLVDLRKPPLPSINGRGFWMNAATNQTVQLPGGTRSMINSTWVANYTKVYGPGSKLVVTLHASGATINSSVLQGIWHGLEFTHGTGIGFDIVRTVVPPNVVCDAGGSGVQEILNLPPGAYQVSPNVRSDQAATIIYYGNSHQVSMQILEVPA